MAKLNEQFETFFSNINPDEKAVKYAQTAHQRVRACIEQDELFGQFVNNTFLYGSYKRHTAVGDIKDVDIVVLTRFDVNDEKNSPNKVLRKLKATLSRCYDDPDNSEYQRRSIRVNDPLPDVEDAQLTLDIIPAVIVTDEYSPLLVPDKEQNKWVKSHPRGHLKRTSALNSEDYGKGRFVPLVKMMKWWWKYQCELRQPEVQRPHPKGFWIECLTAENFDPTQTAWADHFIAVLEKVVSQYTNPTKVPELNDPGLDGEGIKTSMELDEFKIFMETMNESLQDAQLAEKEEDRLKSSEMWRDIFGEQFPLYDEVESETTRKQVAMNLFDDSSHAQPPAWDIRLNKKCKVHLDAYLYKNNTRIAGINSNGRVIPSNFDIKFVARTRTQIDYEVWWQVVNTGKHARQDNGLRGDFFHAKLLDGGVSANPLINWERSLYTGKHSIECFIVREGVCVGRSGRFYVNVKNPDF